MNIATKRYYYHWFHFNSSLVHFSVEPTEQALDSFYLVCLCISYMYTYIWNEIEIK